MAAFNFSEGELPTLTCRSSHRGFSAGIRVELPHRQRLGLTRRWRCLRQMAGVACVPVAARGAIRNGSLLHYQQRATLLFPVFKAESVSRNFTHIGQLAE